MKPKSIVSLLVLASALAAGSGHAQEGIGAQTAPDSARPPAAETAAQAEPGHGEGISNLEAKLESLGESYLETKSIADKLSKIKVSGYVQAQWQYADSMGARTVSGGNFAANSQERFQVRRGRLKTAYETPTSRYVLQFDVIPGGVGIKDAYATVMEPWLKTFSYTMGVFDRPFGFEISYSSSSRESPERARVYQTLFPGERDLGAKVEIAPPAEMGFLQYLNFKGGVFTGMGPTGAENDNNKDLIGRLGFSAPFYDLNLSIDGGVSGYFGKATNTNDSSFSIGTLGNGNKAFIASAGNRMDDFKRNLVGADAQIYYDLPVIGGFSLRGEYMWGVVPTFASPSAAANGNNFLYTGTPSRTADNLSPAAQPLYEREVMGWYLTLVQNLGTRFQAVVKYDVFDPNTEVEGSDIGMSGSGLTASDIMVSTLGLGGIFHWDENTKFVLYYDWVENEEAAFSASSSSRPWNKDLSDNLVTLRMQVKF